MLQGKSYYKAFFTTESLRLAFSVNHPPLGAGPDEYPALYRRFFQTL
jgi:hypothetical protein